MTFNEFFITIGIFILIMAVYRFSDRFVKTLKPQTVRIMNWVGFALGVIGGIAWYFLNDGLFMFISLFGIVIYFLFYGYDRDEGEGEEKKEEGGKQA